MQVKRAGLLTKIVVLALLIYMATSLLNLRGQIQMLQQQLDAGARQVAVLQQANREKREAIENRDDPDVLEEQARNKGFVGKNETLYQDVAN